MNRIHWPRVLVHLLFLGWLAASLPTMSLARMVGSAGGRPPAPIPAPPAPAQLPVWFTERVDAPRTFTQMGNRSLAMDLAGRPHIAYGADMLYYTWYDGTAISDGAAWQVETVDDRGNVGMYTSLALDAAGHPHISYQHATTGTLQYAHDDGQGWQIERVDGAGGVGSSTSLALDTLGRPHISYYDALNGDLKYAHYDGATWTVEAVDSIGNVGSYTALALDSAGRPHIAYDDATNGDLKYARYDGTAWQIETVDAAGTTGFYASLILDPADRPHISYFDLTGGHLRLARYDGTAWQIETVDSTAWSGEYTSLALDAAGREHISYCLFAPPYGTICVALRYASYDGTAWQIETVDGDGLVGKYTSIALDGSGQPRISYYGSDAALLKLASFDGTAWQVETVDRAGDAGAYTSLALDAAGRPGISYYDAGNGDLKYAHFDGTAWQQERVDEAGQVGLYTSLALDSNDDPHIAYYDLTHEALKYARFDGTTWLTETVDGGPDAGYYTSLALDAAGRPHIGYCRYNPSYYNTCYALMYAAYDGTSWQITTVDDSDLVGADVSLALDGDGHPHISYYNAGSQDLKYAHYDGTSWYSETVDSAGIVGQYTSLALDGGGHPHISYGDFTNGTLKYAQHDGTSWLIETVDGGPNVGFYTSLALDGADRPHVSYCLYYPFTNPDTCNELRYAHHDDGGWYIQAVDSTDSVGKYNALQLDPAGRAHISYYDPTNQDLKYAHACIPLEGVVITGSVQLLPGETGVYTASTMPPMANEPITYAWDNGTSGPTAAYSWTVPGTHTLAVTATNPCGESHASFTVTVPCQEIAAVTVAGPAVLEAGATGDYTATYVPPTATLPVTWTWSNGMSGPTAAYSWTVPGTHTLAVTAANPCGDNHAAFTVTVPCHEIAAVTVAGPAILEAGATGDYTATYTPPTATLPVTWTWDNGTSGPTAAYSWTVPGTHTLAVTAANPCGEDRASFTVTVPCHEIAAVTVAGPAVLEAGATGDYTATYAPPTATLPVTWTWSNGTSGPTAVYSWTIPGIYTVTVTATNRCGDMPGQRPVEVLPAWHFIYLPVICRPS